MPDQPLTARTVSSIAEIPAAAWNGLAPSHGGRVDNPFLDHAFFLAAEQSGSASHRTGWQPQHLILEDASGAIVGAMPLYLKTHSQGEYVFDHGWADDLALRRHLDVLAGVGIAPDLDLGIPRDLDPIRPFQCVRERQQV